MAEEKQLPMSGKRRGELTGKGQVPRSQDIGATVTLATGLFGMLYFGKVFGDELARLMVACFTEIGSFRAGTTPMSWMQSVMQVDILISLFFFMFIVMFFAVCSQLAQVGLIFVEKFGEGGLDQFNPINGIKNIFSMRRLVQVGLSLIKLLVIAGFAYASVKELQGHPIFTRGINILEYGDFMLLAAWSLGWRIVLVLGVLAAVDYFYQRHKFEKDNMMNPEDYKEEMKQQEGSPEAKSKMKGLMMRRNFRKQVEDVAKATVVITNPTHYAVALQFERDVTPVPLILAKGQRLNALRIKERAKSLNVNITENVPLAQGLFKHGTVGKPIPVMYYQAVAIVLAELQRQGYRVLDTKNE